METWKAVVGYEGWYDVSDMGRVRRVRAGHGTYIGRIRQPSKDKDGYCLVGLYKEGSQCTCKVHHLVLTAFVGKPKPGQEGNHKNGIKSDNRLEKLEWVTSSENKLHACRFLGVNRGESKPNAKLTDRDILAVRRLLALKTFSLAQIAQQFNVSKSTMGRIKLRQNWAHV